MKGEGEVNADLEVSEGQVRSYSTYSQYAQYMSVRAMSVHDKWSFEQLPLVQRIMNTADKTTTGLSPAELILNHSIRLSAHIMAPVVRQGDPINPALSARMDEWIARHHTLIMVAQDNQHRADQHHLVIDVTKYPINSYVQHTFNRSWK